MTQICLAGIESKFFGFRGYILNPRREKNSNTIIVVNSLSFFHQSFTFTIRYYQTGKNE